MANIDDRIGSYSLISELDSGGFGSVYKAKHIFFDDEPVVAIKLLHAHLGSQKEQEQFIQEAKILKKLKHPYILPILDAGIHERSLYFVVEYAPNGSLRDRLNHQAPQLLPIDHVISILSQVGEALQYAHQQNIVHRDLKPENILFNAKDEVLLADFGIAVVLASGKTKQMGSGGTGAYMAPEQFEGVVSRRSDQYALGCIAYELVTGQRPFHAPHVAAMWYQHSKVDPQLPTKLNPKLPSYIQQAILKAMAKDRRDRYPDIVSFIGALVPRVSKHRVNLGTLGNPDLRCPNCGQSVKAGEITCPNCRMPLTFSASGMNVRLAKPVGGMPPQSPPAAPQPAPILLPSQPPAGVSAQPPVPGLVPANAIPDQPIVQMSPSLSAWKYDQDITVPLHHASSSNGPSAPIVPLEQLSGANSRLGFVVGTRSYSGIERQHEPNQDSLFAAQGERLNNTYAQRFGLFIVADGMSEQESGQDASRLAIKTITERLMPRLSSNEPFTDDGYINLLVEGVQEANAAVHNRNMEHRADMGTTMTSALVVGMTAFVANVGDSRTYLYREPEGLRKVTNDHSVGASLVEAGIIKPDDIYTHPRRNQIYRHLGEMPTIKVDSFKVPLQQGDKLLLCSDGLWKMVRDPLIQQVLSRNPDPSQTGNALIQAALDGGGEENVSVIVVNMTNHTQLSGRPNIQLLARPESPQYPPI